nr:hypothetical protein [Oscillospiraceae bacterium]
MSDAQVIFEIGADDTKAMRSIDGVTDSLKKACGEWEQGAGKATGSIGDQFAGMFAKISVAAIGVKLGQSLLEFGKDAVAAASDLQEVQNVVDATFGSSASQIDAWAKSAASSFGLTELQAKKFTSTLGAMMKSAGMAGPEIVTMSEDLSGLAADMASFYNLDFETAFQKIRSGISGQTEPLKELGINMSVANLEAFALTQGITKAFDAMSQSEQIQLRYQYLMQATSDAQGDFARTSDGYANSLRRMETALDSLKTNVGGFLLTTLEPLTSGLAGFMERLLVPKGTTTVMDEFERIDIDAAAKLRDIETTAEKAQNLLGLLEQIAGYQIKSESSGNLVSFVESFSGSLTGLDNAMEAAKNGDYAGTINELALALSAQLGGDPEKWKVLLTAIGDNAGDAIAAISGDGGKTRVFLEGVAASADDLETDYSGYWANLLTALGNNAAAAITALSNGDASGAVMKAIAEGANFLDASSPQTWTNLLTTLEKVDGLENVFKTNSGDNVRDLAAALSGSAPDTSKATAWQTFLDALGSNVGALSTLTGKSAEETSEWLTSMAAAANQIEPENAEAWNSLLANFVTGLPGLSDTEAGAQFLQQMALEFLAMGTESEEARAGLTALGWSTDQIDLQQKRWLETCRWLVQTIPGISSVVDQETGAINGGTEAIRDYIKEWENYNTVKAVWSVHAQKRQAIDDSQAEIEDLKAQKRYYEAILGEDTINKYNNASSWDKLQMQRNNNDLAKWLSISGELATKEAAQAEAIEKYNEDGERLAETYGTVEDAEANLNHAIEETTREMTTLEKAANGDKEALTDVQKALTDATTAMQDVANYAEQVRQNTLASVNSTVKGFGEIVTPAKKARKELSNVTAEIEKLKAEGKDTSTLRGTEQSLKATIPTIENMTHGLQSQLEYMQTYQENLRKARELGVDESLLASLSDGSQESFDYLQALVSGGGDINQLNQTWQAVQAEKEKFTGTLTDQKLEADSAFQSLVDSANTAIAGLSLGEEAKAAIGDTVQGIVDGLADKKGAVTEQVDGIMAQINRLTAFGGFNLLGGGISFVGSLLNGSHADGLDYVPFDNYLARLHEGEGILTAEENKVWRDFKYGAQSSAIDYGAIGASVWDSAPSGGGNVYLDGVTVGRVISARQADSYRALERSGWRQ